MVQLNVTTHLDLAHHFGQRLAQRGRGGIILVSAVAAAGGLPYMANDSATKAYPLNLGEALHAELAPAGVNVTVHVPVLVNTPVVARIGLDRIGLPADPISPEQAVDEALTALQAGQPTTLTRTQMTTAFDGLKAGVVTMIKARLAGRSRTGQDGAGRDGCSHSVPIRQQDRGSLRLGLPEGRQRPAGSRNRQGARLLAAGILGTLIARSGQGTRAGRP